MFRNPFDVIDDEEDFGEEVCVSLPPEIEQAFKKIAKRDSTTRSKGFTELLDALKGIPNEDTAVYANLMKGSFVKIFEKFLICSEKTSRLAVAELTNILISSSDLKTFLQPILKDILPLWLLSLFDPVVEVSSLQRKTLESVFPAGSKLKLLLEKFDSLIWTELLKFTGPEQFEILKEIAINEMEGTAEEASSVVELVKTEIIGVISLLLRNSHAEEEIKSLLFLKDKEIGSVRRAALYRFTLKFPPLAQFCKSFLVKETNPTSLVAALDLLERTESDELKSSTLSSEKFVINFICSAPVSEFKRFASLPLLPMDEIIVKLCNGNLMNKERLLSFMREVVRESVAKSADRLGLLEKLMFSQLNQKKSSLTAFSPLNVEETMNCLVEIFELAEIVSVCRGKAACPQSIYSLSLVNSSESLSLLESLLGQLKLSDLQSKEILKVLPKDLLTQKLSERISEMAPAEIIRFIQNLSTERAIFVLKDGNREFWANLMTTRTITAKVIKDVLFRIEGFRSFARDQVENVLIVSCALESEISIFDSKIIPNVEVFTEAFNQADCVNVSSPTLKIALKHHLFVDKFKNLSAVDKGKLYKSLELEKDFELFEALECEDEDFFPIGCIESEINVHLDDPVEILMYKTRNTGRQFGSLLSFPLKKFENQRKVAKCAFLCGLIDLINFRVKEEDFDTVTSDPFELFCLSKVLKASEVRRVTSFKDSLKLHCWLSTLDDSIKVNQILDEFIFSEAPTDVSFVALACSIHPLLPVRSDNLAGLITRLLETKNLCFLLLLVSVHLEREELKKEFWQAQFRENLKELCIYAEGDDLITMELKLRTCAAIWNRLSDPEIEILEDCQYKNVLEKCDLHLIQNFEEFGLARLVLMAAPFLAFNIEKLVEFFDSESAASPAMELAYRGVYLQLHLDEKLVAASVQIDREDFDLEAKSNILFPFYPQLLKSSAGNLQKFAVLLELFVSAAEGSREDWKLLGIFAEVLKTRILPVLAEIDGIHSTKESFDFTPRDFEAHALIEHVLHRICALFPLLISQSMSRDTFRNSQMLLEQREIERIRRQPCVKVESVEIVLKPVITSTTKLVNLRVRFADEINLIIDLILPRDFPLEPIRIEGRDKSGLAESKWKASLLSLQTLLRSPTFSGNLIEIIKKWQFNALKLFQGLEECAVCYCVLHPSDKSLPGPACKQCKHKFHATCLYKWFKSSGNATCPLCRALF